MPLLGAVPVLLGAGERTILKKTSVRGDASSGAGDF
jgi:hypothetical protein